MTSMGDRLGDSGVVCVDMVTLFHDGMGCAGEVR